MVPALWAHFPEGLGWQAQGKPTVPGERRLGRAGKRSKAATGIGKGRCALSREAWEAVAAPRMPPKNRQEQEAHIQRVLLTDPDCAALLARDYGWTEEDLWRFVGVRQLALKRVLTAFLRFA